MINNLLSICLSIGCGIGYAQQQDSLSFQSINSSVHFSASLQERYVKNRLRAFNLAKKHGWITHKNYANGNTIALMGTDDFDNPVYYTTHNVIASTGTSTNELYAGGRLGIDLKGDLSALTGKFCIWDGGMPLLTHVEFGGRVVQQDQNRTVSNHTTHLVGTLAAAGINPQAKGMAYNAKVDVWDFTDDVVEMTKEASKILVSNHSYGPIVGWYFNESRPGKDPNLKWEWWGNTAVSSFEDYRFGFYDEKARDFDFLTYNNPFYLIVKSADNKRAENGPPEGTPYFIRNTNSTSTQRRSRNDGFDIIPAEANAKNILTVGGANVNLSNGRLTGYSVAKFSGWGPTDDGRIKPDLLGVGTGIISAVASSNNSYGLLSGTSTASANVSGTLLLLQELFYKNKNFFMRSATLKGLALHTADKPTDELGPSYQYGWGLLNAEKAAKVILDSDDKHLLSELSLQANQVYRKRIMAQSSEPLIVTICWTDPEGIVKQVNAQSLDERTSKLVNDLDIRITDDLGKQYLPWILNPEFPDESATTGDNARDNVEQIVIAKPVLGRGYTISVSHKRTLRNNSQPYSLFISGLLPQNCQTAVKVLSGVDTTLCGSGQMSFEVQGDNGLSYTLLKDNQPLSTASVPKFLITQGGQYVIKATGYDCSADSKPIAVKYDALSVTLQPAGNVSICAGTPLTLKAVSDAQYRYEWHRNGQLIYGATQDQLTPTELGDYTVSISLKNCTAVSTPTRLVSVVQEPAISTNTGTDIPTNGSIKLVTSNNVGMNYEWFWNDRLIPTAKGPRYAAIAPGEYTVRVTQNGCKLTSKPLILSWADKSLGDIPKYFGNSLGKGQISVFPNPVSVLLTVSYQSEDNYDLSAKIINLYGQTLAEKLLIDNGKEFSNQFDISSLPSGVYFVQVTNGVAAVTRGFVKK